MLVLIFLVFSTTVIFCTTENSLLYSVTTITTSLNLSGTATGIFSEDDFSTLATDGKSSTAMVLIYCIMGPQFPWGRISTACTISVLRNVSIRKHNLCKGFMECGKVYRTLAISPMTEPGFPFGSTPYLPWTGNMPQYQLPQKRIQGYNRYSQYACIWILQPTST